jgi:hypothetical protein
VITFYCFFSYHLFYYNVINVIADYITYETSNNTLIQKNKNTKDSNYVINPKSLIINSIGFNIIIFDYALDIRIK